MHDQLPAAALPKPAPGLFWNPYLQIFLTVLLTSAAEILLKVGADTSLPSNSAWSWLGLTELGSWWTWAGILAFVASFGGWLFLGEHIGLLRGSGILVIIAGILLLAQSVARVEEKV
jgi:hypothetical protein